MQYTVAQQLFSERGEAAGPAASAPLLLGISPAVPVAKEIVSAKVKSDELFLRFLATPQARELVQLLLNRRTATVDAPELLLPSPSPLDAASPSLLSPLRIQQQQHQQQLQSSPSRGKGFVEDAFTTSPRRDSPHGSLGSPSRSSWRLATSPPSSPSLVKAAHAGRSSSSSASSTRQSHPQHVTSGKASPRTPKPALTSPARVAVGTPTSSPHAAAHVSSSSTPSVSVPAAVTVRFEHVIGDSGTIWRKGYAPKALEVIDAERLAIQQVFSDAGADTIPVFPPSVDSADAPSLVDRMAQLLQLLQLPLSCRASFAERVSPLSSESPITSISRQGVIQFYNSSLMYATPSRRVFNVIRQTADRQSLGPSDWTPLVQYVADHHPGLGFLRDSGDFLPKYVATVVVRLFHGARVGRIVSPFSSAGTTQPSIAEVLLSQGLHTVTGRSARRRLEMTFEDFESAELSNLLHELDSLTELTRYPNYFDYISFYTIYCKFWELDTDRDMLLRKEDILKFGDYCLSSRIIDRLFEFCRFNSPSGHVKMALAEASPPLSDLCHNEIPMTYQDFVYLVLCNIDMSASASIELWFQCLDIDGDGMLSPQDLYYVYEEQLRRMEYAAMDVLSFDHAFTQILDMVKPQRLERITLSELKKCGQSADIFHLLFNLSEFENDEQRYPLDQRVTRELIDAADEVTIHDADEQDNRTTAVPVDQKIREAAIGKLHKTKWYGWALSQYQAALGDGSNNTLQESDATTTPSSHEEDEEQDGDLEDEDSGSDSEDV